MPIVRAMGTPRYPKDERELPEPVNIHDAVVEAVQWLSSLGDGYALIGGVALSLYGIERYTKDVNFAVTQTQISKAQEILSDHDMKPLRLGGISVKTESGLRVDLIDHRFEYRRLYETAIGHAHRHGPMARIQTVRVPVVSLPYLVAMKLIADRPQDEADLQRLFRQAELDYAEARTIVFEHVGPYAARRLDKLARAAGRTDTPPDYDDA